tara:strand:+ start:318 stop:842 length:525 start_codon:yes stop_codon:yes gene_type:complete
MLRIGKKMNNLGRMLLTALFVLGLTGCAGTFHMHKAQKWEQRALAQVNSGQMKPSAFYQGQYNWLATYPYPNEVTTLAMDVLSRGIAVAQQYEMGGMSTADFNQFNRNAQAAIHKIVADAQRKRQAEAQQAYNNFIAYLVALGETNRAQQSRFVNCTTTAFGPGILRTYNTTCF